VVITFSRGGQTALSQSHIEIRLQFLATGTMAEAYKLSVAKGDCSMADRYKVDCRKFPSDQGCTVTISGSIDEVVDLGWLHAKTHHAHKDEEETGIKEWIRGNAEAAKD
jgi:hypothetical protein